MECRHEHDPPPRRHRQDRAPHRSPPARRRRHRPHRRPLRRRRPLRLGRHRPPTTPRSRASTPLYLVPPSLRLDHAPLVAAFLDRAQAAGVAHVTVPERPRRGASRRRRPRMRAVELDLPRPRPEHAILRPGWFMQDFDEYIFQPAIAADGVIVAPRATAPSRSSTPTTSPTCGRDHAARAPRGRVHALRPGGADVRRRSPSGSRARPGARSRTSTRRSPSGWPRRRVPRDYAALLGMLFDNAPRGHAGERHRRRRARHRPRAAQLRRLPRGPRGRRGVEGAQR